MFKLKTVVLTSILFFSLSAAMADDDDDNDRIDPDKCVQAAMKNKVPAGIPENIYAKYLTNFQVVGHGFSEEQRKKISEQWNKLHTKCLNAGKDTDDCKEATEELSGAKAKFGSACSSAGLRGSSSTGAIFCSKDLEKCGSMGEGGDLNLDEDGDLPYDNEGDAERFRMCPALAKADLKDLKQEVKEAQEKIDDLEKELPEMQEQVQSTLTEMQNNRIAAQEANVNADREYREATAQLNEHARQTKSQIDDKIMQLQQQVHELDALILEQEGAEKQAQLNYAQKVNELEISCYRYSLEKVNALRAEILTKVANSQYNKGGFNQMLHSSGLSSRKQDQLLAEKYYKYCKDFQFKKGMEAAAAVRDVEISNAKNKVDQLKAQKAQLANQSGIANNNERAEAQVALQEQANNINQNYREQKALAAQKAAQADMQAMSQKAIAEQKIATAQTQIEREKAYLKNKRQALSLRTRFATGGSSEGKALDEAFTALSNLQSAASKYRLSCCSGSDDGTAECNTMAAFLGSGNVGEVVASSTPPSSVEAAADPTPAATATAADTQDTTQRVPTASGSQQQVPENIPRPVFRPDQTSPASGAAGARQ